MPKAGLFPALLVEIVLTFFLMLVNMASATDKRFKRADSGLAVGFLILVSGLMANSLSGGSMNPARSLGPALFAGGSALSDVWIYFVGPFLGALLAVGVYQVIRGSNEHTKDVLEEPPDEEKSTLERKQEGERSEVAPVATD
jgi:glycerol uptake facilitator-like aquaporin